MLPYFLDFFCHDLVIRTRSAEGASLMERKVICKKFLLWLTFAFFMFLISCVSQNTLIPNQLKEFEYNGTRTYIVHIPPNYPKSRGMPLVVVLHGYTGTADKMEEWTHFSEKSDKEGFIVLYPNGVAYPWNKNYPQAWNAGGPFETWTRGTDDVGFLQKLIKYVQKLYFIDEDRIYITGHSNGARMAYRAIYELSWLFAAAAPVAGFLVYEDEKFPQYPVPFIHLHAKDDTGVPYGGQELGGIQYPGAEEMMERWASFFNCKAVAELVEQNRFYTIQSRSCPDSNFEAVLLSTETGNHNWMTIENSGINATDVIWEFLKNHKKSKH